MSQNKQRGFTIVELMIAVAFISVLLVLIAISTMYVSNIFTKGITLRTVNQAGRLVIDDMRRSVAESPVILRSGTHDFLSAARPSTTAKSGYFCTGRYSYVWNLGHNLQSDTPSTSQLLYSDGSPIRFARFEDPSGQICLYPTDRTKRQKGQAVELLSSGDRDLVLGSLSVIERSTDPTTEQALYEVNMVIRTNDAKALTTDRARCRAPGELETDADANSDAYCAVNSFSFITRAGSRI